MHLKLFPTIVTDYVNRKYIFIKLKIRELLRNGLSPQKLALAVAGGIILGSFPLLIPGATTLLCVSFAVKFRLNIGLIHIINVACSPLQIILYLPFLKAGKLLFQLPMEISWSHLILQFKEDFLGTLQMLGILNLAGIVAWLIFAVFFGLIIYYVSLLLILNLNPTRHQ